jgi:hypothetical protein
MPTRPPDDPNWRSNCVIAIDTKFSDPGNLSSWRRYVRAKAYELRRDDLVAAPDEVVNHAYIKLRRRVERATTPDELGREWPSHTYIYRTLYSALHDLHRASRFADALSPDLPGDTDVQREADAEFEKQRALSLAEDTVNSLGLTGELRARAMFAVRRRFHDVDGVRLPIAVAAPTDYDQALYEALAYIDLNILREPVDPDEYRTQLQRRKRKLKRQLEDFRTAMGELLD